MKFEFIKLPKSNLWQDISDEMWSDWKWQVRNSLKSFADFNCVFDLEETHSDGFKGAESLFKVQSTPYYANLCVQEGNVLKKILLPTRDELFSGKQSLKDPLGEVQNKKAPRIIHRYSDRVLFLVTDQCQVYCRYCTRKHFTGQDAAFIKNEDYEKALDYIKSHPGICEVILSGGDALNLSNSLIEKVLSDLRSIDHVEIIRIGSRVPVVNPMRVDRVLAKLLRNYAPIFLMTHFNHPSELTYEAKSAIDNLVDNGIPVMNQMVLLNGVNNHSAIVQALSRRLLYLRVKPYYMFQCDPSEGTDHLRTTIEDSESIQKELWGHLSGLAMPNLSLDIPEGGGKTYLVPNFEIYRDSHSRTYKGWDGVEARYVNPEPSKILKPLVDSKYLNEWELIKKSKSD